MGVTVKDIAEDCGISRGTVDRALHDRPGVNTETRRRVLASVKKLGYRPDMLAQGLVKGKSFSIGLVTFNMNNNFVTEFISSVEFGARQEGYFTYITNSDMKAEGEEDCINHLIQRRVDGIILQSMHPARGYARWLHRQGIPLITVGNRVSAASATTTSSSSAPPSSTPRARTFQRRSSATGGSSTR